jgi:hypothetical protein
VFLSGVNITASNSTGAVNGQGLIALSTVGNAVIMISGVLFDGIQLSVNCNGAFSLNGDAQSLSVVNSTFRSIRTGNAGGAIYLNVSSYVAGYSLDTYIANTVCIFIII